MKLLVLSILLIYQIILCSFVYGDHDDSYYKILDVSKHATDLDIRKAFKKKALELHPDKNYDDKDAQEKFIELNNAYQVLKDEDLRRKYDLHGKDGLNNFRSRGSNYQSWNYYHDNFGIYDDDIEIITLNKADFDISVTKSEDVWFINFYHPSCSHCHTLAPVWRKVAKELDGIVRIGAVNCDDDYPLCKNQGIRSYPTLKTYPGAVQYSGLNSQQQLVSFIMHWLRATTVYSLSESHLSTEVNQCPFTQWLVITKPQFEDHQYFDLIKLKIGAIFKGLLCLAEVNCDADRKLCSSLEMEEKWKFFSNKDDLMAGKGFQLDNIDIQEMSKEVLEHFPNIRTLSPTDYKVLLNDLKRLEEPSHKLVIFTDDDDDVNLELRKLPGLLPSFDLSLVSCDRMKNECDELFIVKTPSFAVFKPGGGYEMHLGRPLVKDVAIFALEAALASHFQVLTPKQFPAILNDGDLWFVDFYAPWCPPCMTLLPEFRKASRFVELPVKFGTIDCTAHKHLCSSYNVHQYPTTILYNQSVAHHYVGVHLASHLADFVKITIENSVIVLDTLSYELKIKNKSPDELWIVDYFANWCGHCVHMAADYRQLSHMLESKEFVRVAQIDCAVYREICLGENISGYPTIKLFPLGSFGTDKAVKYTGWGRNAKSFYQWVYPFLPNKISLLDERTFEEMLRSKRSHLLYFYSPRVDDCQRLAPEFEEACNSLDTEVKCVKVNCDSHSWLCQAAQVQVYPSVVLYGGIFGSTQRQMPRGQPLNSVMSSNIVETAKWVLKSIAQRKNQDEHLQNNKQERDEL